MSQSSELLRIENETMRRGVVSTKRRESKYLGLA